MITIGYVDSAHLFEAYVGDFCHTTRADGGHVRMRATRPGVRSFTDLNAAELAVLGEAMQRLSNAIKTALTEHGINIHRVNIHIDGNWSDLYRTTPPLCIHFYGRATDAEKQPLGQSLRFPSPREHAEFYEGNEPINADDIARIRELLQNEQ